jgi:predicted transcriptional regulator
MNPTLKSYRRLRQREGISLDEISAEVEIPKKILVAWETGLAKPVQSEIRRYFLALDSLIARKRQSRRAELKRTPVAAKPKPRISRVARIKSAFRNLGSKKEDWT